MSPLSRSRRPFSADHPLGAAKCGTGGSTAAKHGNGVLYLKAFRLDLNRWDAVRDVDGNSVLGCTD